MATPENPATDGDNVPEPSGEAGRVVSIPGEQRIPTGFVPSKRGPGRPPGSKNGESAASGKHYTKAEIAARRGQNDPELDPALIGDLFVSLSEITDDMFVLAILTRARQKLTPEIYPKFKEEMEKIRLGDKDKNMIRGGGIALAKKYTFLLRWGPEVILIVCAVQYLARMGNAFRRINSLPDLKVSPKPPETAPTG